MHVREHTFWSTFWRRSASIAGSILLLTIVALGFCSKTHAAGQEKGRLVVTSLSPTEVTTAICAYQFCKSFTAIPHHPVFAVGVFYITPSCEFVGLGSFSKIIPPRHGVLWFGYLDIVPSCSTTGKAIKATVAFYAWRKLTPSKVNNDAFSIQYTSFDGEQSLSIGLNAELQPSPVGPPISPECTAALAGATIKVYTLGVPLFNKTQIGAKFTPQGGLVATAKACGFKVADGSINGKVVPGLIKGFNWVQTVETYSQPSFFPSGSPGPKGTCVPNALPFNDPPLNGYCGQTNTYFSYPFDYSTYANYGDFKNPDVSLALINYEKTDENYCPKVDDVRSTANLGDAVLCFEDRPQINVTPDEEYYPAPYVIFTTSLVGILESDGCANQPFSAKCPGKPSAPIAQWVWEDSFRDYQSLSYGNIRVISASSNVTFDRETFDQ